MADLSGLLACIKEYNKKFEITENSTDAEKLRKKLMQRGLSNDECLTLQQEVLSFLNSDAPEVDKKMIRGYTESLCMICSAIERGLL